MYDHSTFACENAMSPYFIYFQPVAEIFSGCRDPLAMAPAHEETNGPVPRVDIFDENGLAQQTSGPPGDPRGPPNQTAGAAAIHDFDLTNETLSMYISPDMMGAMRDL